MNNCRVEISRADHEAIQQVEAVLIREYENAAGERWGELVFWGSIAECQDTAEALQFAIVPDDISLLGDMVVPVSKLVQPQAAAKEGL